jgi:hypothetical protein
MARGNSRAQSELQPIRGEKAAFRLGVRDALASLPAYAKGKVTVYEGEPYTPGRKSTTVTIKEAMKLPINLQRQILERYATYDEYQVTRDGKPITKEQRQEIEAEATKVASERAQKEMMDNLTTIGFDVDDVVGKSEVLTGYAKIGDNIFKYNYQVTNETATEYKEYRRPRSQTYTTRRIIEGSLEQA